MSSPAKKQASAASWPLDAATTTKCIELLPSNADVLACDLVSRSFRSCKAELPQPLFLNMAASCVSGAAITGLILRTAGRVHAVKINGRQHTLQAVQTLATTEHRSHLSSLTFTAPYSCNNFQLPEALWQISSLQQLSISRCLLPPLGSTASAATCLTQLTINDTIYGALANLSQLVKLQWLVLDNCYEAHELSDGITNLTGLLDLVVKNSSVCILQSTCWHHLTTLTSLELAPPRHCWATPVRLPDQLFSDLKLLQVVKLSGVAVPSSLAELTGLEVLNLNWTTIPTGLQLGKLSRLLNLTLHLGYSEVLPATITALHSLQHLELTFGGSSLPASFGYMASSLNSLVLKDCRQLNSLGGLLALTSLTELDMQQCTSVALDSPDIRGLHLLQRLVLNRCCFIAPLPPDTLDHLSSLQSLFIQQCGRCLEGMAGGAVSRDCAATKPVPLQEVYLHGGEYMVCYGATSLVCMATDLLPAGIASMAATLRSVELRDFLHLQHLPAGLGHCSNLQTLVIMSCKRLAALPDTLGRLGSLTALVIDDCPSLAALPAEVAGWSGLQQLQLQDCRSLQQLPASFGSCSNLTRLAITSCHSLLGLPDTLSLQHLQQLHLQSCKSISSLPGSLGNSTALCEVVIDNCPVLEAVHGSWHAVIGLQEASIWGCLKLALLPDVLRAASGHPYHANYRGLTGRLYPINLAFSPGDVKVGSKAYITPLQSRKKGVAAGNVDADVEAVVDTVHMAAEAPAGNTRRRLKTSQKQQQGQQLQAQVLVKWKGRELDVTGGWLPLDAVRHTAAWEAWNGQGMSQCDWFKAVTDRSADSAFKTATGHV